MTCHLCGKTFVQGEPVNVLTAPLTVAEREEWWRTQSRDAVAFAEQQMWLTLLGKPGPVQIEAPYIQTYYVCRPCIQPVIHAGVRSPERLREQFQR
jgi:hypothetical protein